MRRHLRHDDDHQHAMISVMPMTHEDRVRERRGDLALELRLLLHEVGEPLEHRLERARGLARRDHVHVERREDSGAARAPSRSSCLR